MALNPPSLPRRLPDMGLPLGSIISVATESLGLVKAREKRNNTQDMKANAEAVTRQELRDKIAAAISAGDLEEIRRLAAEI